MSSTIRVVRAAAPDRPLAEPEAFSAFFDRSYLAVFRFVYGLHGGPREDVEDLAAECFIRAWRSRNRFSGDREDEIRWILRIARNLVIDAFRRAKARPPAVQPEDFSPIDPASGPEELAELAEQHDKLLRALQRVPEHQREILVLRYLLGWRVKDIAAHLEILDNTVSVQIRRALARLRSAWTSDSAGEENYDGK